LGEGDDLVCQLDMLSRTESGLGFSIDLECGRLVEAHKKDLALFTSIPGMSLVNGLYASRNYADMGQFVNSSLEELKAKTRMSEKRARRAWNFLNELN
jgi:hypothetical protein